MTGKVGTDIQEGKCSWLIVQVLQRTTKEQRMSIKLEVCYLSCSGQWLGLDYKIRARLGG